MKTIWKFPLKVDDEQTISVPEGAQLLSVQDQSGKPCLWALVNPDADKKPLSLLMFGTGDPVRDDILGLHVDTFQMLEGELVFHVFVKK